MVSVKATVLRDGTAREIAVAHLVPGDVVELASGDMIPGDVRVVQAKDLFVIQGSLTGESLPVEKFAVESRVERQVGKSAAALLLESRIGFRRDRDRRLRERDLGSDFSASRVRQGRSRLMVSTWGTGFASRRPFRRACEHALPHSGSRVPAPAQEYVFRAWQ